MVSSNSQDKVNTGNNQDKVDMVDMDSNLKEVSTVPSSIRLRMVANNP
jgi:hypothetical protein